MTYSKAKKLQNGSKIFVQKTNKLKVVIRKTECAGKDGEKYFDILCDDYTSYYNTEVEVYGKDKAEIQSV